MQRRLAHLGVVLLLLGAVALAAPTFGFSTIAADRGTAVQTAEDPNALVGFEPTSEEIAGRHDTATAFSLRNNADQALDLSTTHALSGSGLAVATDGSGTVPPGQATPVVVECTRGGVSGTATITTTVDATGASMSIEGASSSTTFDYECSGGGDPPGGGPADFVANDPEFRSGGWLQRFEVDVGALGNGDQLTIDLGDAQATSGVDYSSATASVTSGQNAASFGFDPQSSTITYTARGNAGGTLVVELRNLQLTDDRDGTASFSDATGRSGSDSFGVPAVANDGGSTDTDGDAVVENGTAANGQIQADGDVVVGDDASTNGQVQAGGDVAVGDGATLNQQVQADGSVTLGDDVGVNDQLQADGDVLVGEGVTLDGQVQSTDGDVVLGAGSTANAQVQAPNGDVYLEDGTTVQQQVDAGGTVYVGCDVTINGQIDAPTESTC